MTTKQKILKEALTLFAEKGYGAVYVGDIAKAVGICKTGTCLNGTGILQNL